MDKIESVWRILPILNIGMYWGSLNTDNTIDHYNIDEDFKEGYINFNSDEYWDGFDNKLYTARVLESAQNTVDEHILPVFESLGLGITGIEVTGINSPDYYNFRDDWLEFNIIVKNKYTLIEALKETYLHVTDDVLDAFFHESYGSYDGFHSFMSSSAEAVLEGINEGKDDEICQLIHYILSNHEDFDSEAWAEALYEDFTEDFFYSEFLTEEFLDKYETGGSEVESFIQQNYAKHDRDEMVQIVGKMTERIDEDDEWVEDGHELTKRIVNRVCDNIESHNLKLDLGN